MVKLFEQRQRVCQHIEPTAVLYNALRPLGIHTLICATLYCRQNVVVQ